jgi:hypothetical protein
MMSYSRIALKHFDSEHNKVLIDVRIRHAEEYSDLHQTQPNLFVQLAVKSIDLTNTRITNIKRASSKDC